MKQTSHQCRFSFLVLLLCVCILCACGVNKASVQEYDASLESEEEYVWVSDFKELDIGAENVDLFQVHNGIVYYVEYGDDELGISGLGDCTLYAVSAEDGSTALSIPVTYDFGGNFHL